ncbi:hypothetical protein RHSIM_Rhsim04G0077600 [Rhododendron simsii]|uniref:Uncharacterized protein n=1 Tax=Rhododendron simsii TaxID=118357 RepID=A0A834H2N7_RHOSS|nr:hypothetical protein RHSIM_Rhsim04G0077600 [Rhododendron simsii]
MVRDKGKGKTRASSIALAQDIVEEFVDSGSEEPVAGNRVEGRQSAFVKAKSIGTDCLVIQCIQSKGFETSGTPRITSKVGNKDIMIDPSMIAEYLGYELPPPEMVNYPRDEQIDIGLINNVLHTDPKMATIPHGVKGLGYNKKERLDPRDITSAFLKKSKPRSSAPRESSRAYLTTKPGPKEKKDSIWNKLFCQNVAIRKCLWKADEKRKKDKERRQLAREVGKLTIKLQWQTKILRMSVR